MTVVDLQLSPANATWQQLRDASIEAEQRGVGALWVLDHLAGLPVRGSTMIECFTLLGALAHVTERVDLGTMVANVWNRQVGTLVSAAASVALVSDRQFHLGIGAGAGPTSSWAAEQHVVGAHIEPSIALRHDRVEAVLELARREWDPHREESFATFPLPRLRPTTIVGVNSVGLSRLAGARADGINIPWRHPQRDEFIATADAAAGERPFLRTAYTIYHPDLLDPTHPDRVDMTERRIERLVLAVFGPLDEWHCPDLGPV
ncbi:MAG: LLM class flavin-dependent oxidoreductase [Ilumatobacteraceae bacterium]